MNRADPTLSRRRFIEKASHATMATSLTGMAASTALGIVAHQSAFKGDEQLDMRSSDPA